MSNQIEFEEDPEEEQRYGTWSVVDEKLRITYKDSEQSVLFEDTASISYLKIATSNPMYLFLGLFGGAGLFIFIALVKENLGLGFFVWAASFAIGLILMFVKKIKYDNVSIETRGGKIIRFSVDFGDGKSIMEQIEEEKRKWSESRK